MNAIDELRGVFDNFACNMAKAYADQDWEMVRVAFETMQGERKEGGFPLYRGGPTIPTPYDDSES